MRLERGARVSARRGVALGGDQALGSVALHGARSRKRLTAVAHPDPFRAIGKVTGLLDAHGATPLIVRLDASTGHPRLHHHVLPVTVRPVSEHGRAVIRSIAAAAVEPLATVGRIVVVLMTVAGLH